MAASPSLPPAWDLSTIQPDLKFCMRGKPDVIYKHDDQPEALFQEDHIRTAKRFVFVTHGFLSTGQAEWLTLLKNAIFAYEEANKMEDSVVVILGWGLGANLQLLQYAQAISNSQTVGDWLGNTAKAIWDWNQSRPNKAASSLDIVGIGYSLGAHLMGAAGRTSQIFNAIIALDPAGPRFETVNADKRLKKEDAIFVQVIHTDAYSARPQAHPGPQYAGTLAPLGHVDFYPNWGYEQPGVETKVNGSHYRAVELFIWSITNRGKFLTNRKLTTLPEVNTKPEMKADELAGNFAEMGYHTSRDIRGCFYIRTNEKAPWNYTGDFASDPKLVSSRVSS